MLQTIINTPVPEKTQFILFTTIYQEMLQNSKFIKSANFEEMAVSDLKKLFELYDKFFFQNYFTDTLGKRISFKFNRRLKSSAGQTKFHMSKGLFVISFSPDLFFHSFDGENRDIEIGGLKCQDRLEALMRVMEHEMIHLVEFHLTGKSRCAGKQFRTILWNMFGHVERKHKLVTLKEKTLREKDLQIGDMVEFPYKKKILKGLLYRFSNKATVMVQNSNGNLRDKEGNRFSKFLVPIDLISKT